MPQSPHRALCWTGSLVLCLAPLAAQAQGPDIVTCATDGGPAFLVQVSDFKNRQGTVRVRLFGGDPATYFDRTQAIVRIQIPVPPNDPVAICVPAPAPGIYAIDIRHDANGNDATDRGDGGGISENPRLSLWDVAMRRRPSPVITQITAGRGVQIVQIKLRYL